MQDETALIRKSTDVTDDLEDSDVKYVYIVQYSGTLFDVFSSEPAAQRHALLFKGSHIIVRRVM